jgi:hypothetical protein
VDSSADAAQLRAKTLDSAQRRIEGSDTSKGNGSVVAAIRDKYTRAVSGSFRRLSHHLDLARPDHRHHRLEIFLVCHLALLRLQQSISPKIAVNRQPLLGGKLGRPSTIYRIVLVT